MTFKVFYTALLSMCVLLGKGVFGLSFDCARDKPDCSGNGDGSGPLSTGCQASGACVCDATHEGYNCFLLTSTTVGCSLTCLNGGTCYNDGSEKCFCGPDHFGTTCQISLAGGGFNCDRDNSDCSTHGICGSDHFCTCTDNTLFRGFDCGQDVSKITTTGVCASETCSGHGTCYDNAGSAACYCDYYYWSDAAFCDTPRIPESPTCSADEMSLKIVPYMTGSFSGDIYVLSDEAKTTACTVTLAAGKGDVTMKYDNAICATVSSTNVADATATDYTNDIIVQYFPTYKHQFDLKVTVTCTLSDTGTQTGTVTTVVNDNTRFVNTDSSKVEVPPLTSEFVDASGNTVSVASVFIADVLRLEISLSDTTVYSKVKVDACTFTDANTPVVSSNDVVVGGCKQLSQSSIFDSLTRDSASQITVKWNAFKYESSSSLTVTCLVNLCRTGFMTACDDSACTGANDAGPGIGRKKRAATDDTRVIERTIKVFEGTRPVNEQQQKEEQTVCSMAMETIVMLAVLGLFVFALSILTVGLSCWVIRMRSRKTDDTHSLKI